MLHHNDALLILVKSSKSRSQVVHQEFSEVRYPANNICHLGCQGGNRVEHKKFMVQSSLFFSSLSFLTDLEAFYVNVANFVHFEKQPITAKPERQKNG